MKTSVMDEIFAGIPGKSNWPDLPACKDRKEKSFYCVDVNDETVCTSTSKKIAQEAAKSYGGIVRPVTVTEATLREDTRKRRGRINSGDFRA